MRLEEQSNQLQRLMAEGNDCLKQKKLQQAFLCFNKVVLSAPECQEALVGCAEILIRLNRPAEAVIYSQHALQRQTDCIHWALHARALYHAGRFVDALECFESILAKEPNNSMVLGQRALCLTQVNRYDEALIAYQQALACGDPQDFWLRYNYSLCLLAMGNLLSGFALFEYRWFSILREKRYEWKIPESACVAMLQGKSILIHSEQGLGDTIQFFRYIPLLVQFGARVILEMQPSLIPLFDAWHPTITFIAKGSFLPSCDYHCPMMSLARLFQTELHTIPQATPYVFPNLAAFVQCQKKLGQPTRRRIGIAWRGSASNAMNQKRSIALSRLLSLYQPTMDFICLQQDVYPEEKKELDHYQIAYHSLELSTMVGTAALIACLDLVITIDTSIAHLSAAMGKDVWIILPLSADWRWFLQREESPWYPNVTLFRQETLDDWNIPLARIKNALVTSCSVARENRMAHGLQQAQQQVQQGLFSQAEQLYRDILVTHPGCSRAAQGMALAALAQNNKAGAMQWMQHAVAIAPNVALYRRNLGELLRRVQQFEAAIASHLIAIDIEPHSAENHYQLALAYNDNQQFASAVTHYRRALSYDPNYGLAWNNLGASLESLGIFLHWGKHWMIRNSMRVHFKPMLQETVCIIYTDPGIKAASINS